MTQSVPDAPGYWPLLLCDEPSGLADRMGTPWRTVLDEAQAHGVLATLAGQLRRSGLIDELPAAEQARCQQVYRHAVAASLAKRAAFEISVDALARIGIVPVGYKGVALAHLVYPDPAFRSMTDLDFWLPEGRMDHAIAALSGEGFFYRHARESRPRDWQIAFGGEEKLQHPHLGLVELHYDIFDGEWLQRATKIDRAAMMSRLLEVSVLGRRMRVLAPRDHIVQVALHAAISNRHSLMGLRGLLDIVLLAAEIDDWDALCKDIDQWRIRRVMAHAFALAGAVFQHRRLQEAAAQLAKGFPTRWLDWHLDADAVLRRVRLTDPVRRWSFLLVAADRRSDALHLIAHTLWPDTDWLKLRYGSVHARQRFGHLANVLRGRI